VSTCEELYADDDSTGDPCEDRTEDHAFDSIQETIEVAMDGFIPAGLIDRRKLPMVASSQLSPHGVTSD